MRDMGPSVPRTSHWTKGSRPMKARASAHRGGALPRGADQAQALADLDRVVVLVALVEQVDAVTHSLSQTSTITWTASVAEPLVEAERARDWPATPL